MGKRREVMKVSKVIAKSTTNSANMVWGSESYKECQKNLAASIGGYALDGCQEYIASGEEGTDLALVCAACGCHRSFHRRVVDQEVVELDVAPECSSSTSSIN